METQQKEKVFFVYTTGCPASDASVNVYRSILCNLGVSLTNSIDKATDVIYRPCTFEESQIEKSLVIINDLIERGKNVILAGCIIPLRDWCKEHNILVCENPNFKEFFIENFPDEIGKATNQVLLLKNRVPVTIGCYLKSCAYCNIPNVEYGKTFRSTPEEEIFKWIDLLVSRGWNEVHLCGDDVTPYGCDFGKGYHGLPELLLKIKYRYPDLKIIATNLNIAFAKYWSNQEVKTVVECIGNLHLPIQSGDNDILKSMGRPYTRKNVLELYDLIKSYNGRISTDCMVGFPGETDEQFKKTLEIVQHYCFEFLQGFAFTPVPGTLAAKMSNQISEEVKLDRLTELIYWAIKMNPKIKINTNRE